MAVNDIVAQTGDRQDLVLEIPAGNPSFVAGDSLLCPEGVPLLAEIPVVVGSPGGGNIFIMSE